ncbi:MAG: tetratricopeptide repeat protein [Candidatus Ratteibacteria bacterium]|nr:tetratricopeptide repeat protein [Candidatus Ratteibacteria bacterium]
MPDSKVLEVYRKIIFWGLLVIIAVLPCLYTTKTFHLVLIKTVFLQLALSFLFFVWFLKLGEGEFIKLPQNPVIIPFALFVLYAFLSASFSLYKYNSFRSFFSYLGYFLLFIFVIENVKKRWQIRLVSQIILITAGFICLYSLYKNISFLKFNFWKAPVYFNFFGNPNFFASYLLAVLPLSFSLFIYSHFKFEKIVLFILSLLISLSLLLTYSQGCWIIFFFYFMLFYIGLIINYWRKKQLLKSFLFGAFPFLIFVVLYGVLFYSQGPVEKYLFPINASLAVRKDLWGSAWQMIKIFPVMGWGTGNFHIYFPLYRTLESLLIIESPIVFHAHSEFLELAAEMGFLGLTLFLWMILSFLIYTLKVWLKAPLAWKKYPLAFFLGGLGILMHNLISPSLRWTAIAAFFWLMAALAVSVKRVISEEERDAVFITLKNRLFPLLRPVRKGLLYALAIVLFIPLSLEIIKPYRAETALKEGIKAWDKENFFQAIVKFEQAKRINPYCLSAYYRLGYSYRMTGNYQKALENYQALEKICPNYARLHYNLGSLYQDLGQFRQAIGEFKTALQREDRVFSHDRLREIYFELEK